MTPDSPGVLASEGAAYIVPTGSNVASMRTVAAHDRVAGEPARGWEPGREVPTRRGTSRAGCGGTCTPARSGAARAIDLLLSKLEGAVRTEIEPPTDRVPVPPPIADPATVTVALVTEAGCVPQGNPDRLPTRHANVWLRYSLQGVDSMSADRYETVHAGFDTAGRQRRIRTGWFPWTRRASSRRAARSGASPTRFYTTSGVDTPVATAAKFGQEIAAELREAKIGAVILTGT